MAYRTKAKRLGRNNALRGDPVEQDGTAQAVKNEFARRITARRIALGVNQSEVARRATNYLPKAAKGQLQGHKLGRDLINRYESGRSIPRPEYLAVLAKALQCEPGDLVPAGGVMSTVGDAPAFSMHHIGSDRVHLRVNRGVSLSLAEKIIGLLKKEDA